MLPLPLSLWSWGSSVVLSKTPNLDTRRTLEIYCCRVFFSSVLTFTSLLHSPHTLPPSAVVRAHLHPHLAQQHSQLSAALANTKLENESLFSQVKAQREEIESLLSALDGAVSDIDGANALLGPVADDLAAEARKADADIEAVATAGAARPS